MERDLDEGLGNLWVMRGIIYLTGLGSQPIEGAAGMKGILRAGLAGGGAPKNVGLPAGSAPAMEYRK